MSSILAEYNFSGPVWKIQGNWLPVFIIKLIILIWDSRDIYIDLLVLSDFEMPPQSIIL